MRTSQKIKSNSHSSDNSFKSHGKLLLTGEYLVLEGAEALGLKTTFSQTFEVNSGTTYFTWTSLDDCQSIWFETKFHVKNNRLMSIVPKFNNTENVLLDVLNVVFKEKPALFQEPLNFKTTVDFPLNWGLGTSSTLISNLAKWSQLDPYWLLNKSFGGSGYDVAIAINNSHVNYQLKQEVPTVIPINFEPVFKENIFFVYLNEKQNSRNEIKSFYEKVKGADLQKTLKALNEITKKVQNTNLLSEFESELEKHEVILSKVLNVPCVKDRLFPDYKGGVCKSLGAWGGDFMLVTGTQEEMHYFRDKGYTSILNYSEMIAE